MLDWTGMRDFLAVAEEGSLSAAAKKLKVSQPTMGRRIAQLEDRMGATLFVRTPRGLDLAEAGELILDHARRMENEAHAVERLLTGREAGLTGSIKISTIDTIGAGWLVQEFLPFRDRYPDISVEIHTDPHVVDLLRHEADIAIRLFASDQGDLITKTVAQIHWGFYASRDYIRRHGMPQSFDDLQNHTTVATSEKMYQMIEPIFKVPEFKKGKVAFRSNNMTAHLNATRAGYGIGVHTALMVKDAPELVRIFPDVTVLELDVMLVTHPDLKRSARVRAGWEFLSDLFRRNRKLLLGEAEPGKV